MRQRESQRHAPKIAVLCGVCMWACFSSAKDAKSYPLTLTFLGTTASTMPGTPSQSQTTCSPDPATQQLKCNTHTVGGGPHTVLTSIVQASDGKTYSVTCMPGMGAAFAQGMANGSAAQSNLPTRSGCQVMPGTYLGRLDRGRLKVLMRHSAKGKVHEVTFEILASVPTQPASQPQASASQSQVPSTIAPKENLEEAASAQNPATPNGVTPAKECSPSKLAVGTSREVALATLNDEGCHVKPGQAEVIDQQNGEMRDDLVIPNPPDSQFEYFELISLKGKISAVWSYTPYFASAQKAFDSLFAVLVLNSKMDVGEGGNLLGQRGFFGAVTLERPPATGEPSIHFDLPDGAVILESSNKQVGVRVAIVRNR